MLRYEGGQIRWRADMQVNNIRIVRHEGGQI